MIISSNHSSYTHKFENHSSEEEEQQYSSYKEKCGPRIATIGSLARYFFIVYKEVLQVQAKATFFTHKLPHREREEDTQDQSIAKTG